VTLGVESRAATAASARAAASEAMQGLLAQLRASGVADADIQTSNLELEPDHDHRDGTAVLRGYRVSNQAAVTLRDLARAGDIIDAALDSAGDAARLRGVRFSFADAAPLYDQARRGAMADARQRAATFADSAGVAVGEVLEITEMDGSNGEPGPRVMFAARAASMPVQAGESGITASVRVQFALEPPKTRKTGKPR